MNNNLLNDIIQVNFIYIGEKMELRFRKSIKICKGMKLNFGKTGASVSFGTRGLHYTVHTSGRRTTSVGIPGTGLSYTSSSSGKRSKRSRTNVSIKAQKTLQVQQQKEEEYNRNCEMVDNFNELLDMIRSIHEECSEIIDWPSLRDKPEPFNRMFPGPCEEEALRSLHDAKPGFLGKLIPAAHKSKMQKLNEAVLAAQERDRQNYSDWENMKKLAERVLSGDIDSYFYVVSEMHPFDEILDYGSDFNIGTDIPNILEVEFHAKTDKVVPNHILEITKTGKLSSKKMSKTMHFDIAQDYICSCVIRIAREIFALLPIENIAIHVVDKINPLIGDEYEDTVLSVLIDRDRFEKINFSGIDASDTIETFNCNMNFKKTGGLKPVKRVEVKI